MRCDPMKRFTRLWKHCLCDAKDVRRVFGHSGFEKIEQAIADGERRHNAEICFAVEASLDAYRIWAQVTPRERAHTHFSRLRVWDTAENNGVLIYVLWADRSVEILVDREVNRLVPERTWVEACQMMSKSFQQGKFSEGVVEAIGLINLELARAFPHRPGDRNELGNAVTLL
jgi:uncharacterized membrane protein